MPEDAPPLSASSPFEVPQAAVEAKRPMIKR
jgi:hypothetical protein